MERISINYLERNIFFLYAISFNYRIFILSNKLYVYK